MAVASTPTGETPCTRTYFYAGGKYVSDGKGGHSFEDQIYVEQLSPIKGSTKPYPLVFIHGFAQTGTNWLNKPDGGRGWASYFLSEGYEVYIIDQTSRGRSPWLPGSDDTIIKWTSEQAEELLTATEKYNKWPQAKLHTQWPGTGLRGDEIFDAYFASTVQSRGSDAYQQTTVQSAGAALLDRIGQPVILITHSQAGALGWLVADARPKLVHSIVALEPSGPPFENAVLGQGPARPWGLTDVPLTYFPPVSNPQTDLVKKIVPPDSSDKFRCIYQAESPPPRQLINLANIKVLVVTAEASYHAMYDYCTAAYLRQAGVSVDELALGKAGIHGNGHMLFLEKNSDEIAFKVQEWIEK
ncbi:hypothetical protein AJ79_09192 [Helicocarpus griseus UAMH5409]|uniref:AB hydrolase-1 domain-containing protein n=1 Tax=Helicocarpus griseus UAMH5409 TaxID=1447875 RepID=A0A2B7WLH6_9EURO|nr:hypothetical protein AJ79_09192 [Helicocarpus griseus UAMH5409]